jgi:carbamoyl-phosphate synthase large subunit
MPKFEFVRKVLILGSGAIKIGEAAEFDYSGSQCLKALSEEGIETVLINPNIATIQTDPRLAGKVYLLPVTPEYAEKVIEKERPDGILLGFGGQTALNCMRARIKAVQSLGIVGECNIQWALNPKSEEFRAIEINARMSRSSALASKATGYPLAYIATKLAIGYLLPELINKVTGVTTACFEPAMDYIAVKFPRWDFRKFRHVDRHIGPQMKSVGEVMAIGRCFEEALQKAVRMLDIGKKGLVCNREDDEPEPLEKIRDALANPTDERLFKIVKAIKMGMPIEEIYKLSGIDLFFLYKIKNIVDMERKLRSLKSCDEASSEIIKEAKRLGFSDEQIAICLQTDEMTIRELREKAHILPVVKQIDTLAAEWPAMTNYLYLTYGGDEDDIDFGADKSKVIVLGAGVFRIGSSVEFDWYGVNTIWALKKFGVQEAIMVNCNPETVSTDYDISDKLYFEELTLERVLDIYEKEKPLGVIVSVGGQIPNNLALKLANSGVRLLGTSAENIDRAEDRAKFSALLDYLKIPQPEWSKLTTIEDVKKFAKKIGYPVLVRPSYVLSGSAMRVVYSEEELENSLKLAAEISREHPVVVSKFIEGAKEVEVDGVSDGEHVLIGAIIEHIENAGVHSGDATMVIPPQTLPSDVLRTIEDYTHRIIKALQVKGPFNIQYLVKNGVTYVIECNLRASRSMPFVSKTRGIPLIELATLAMLDKKIQKAEGAHTPFQHVGVKVPQFSFMRLSGADPVLGVEMLSTGEVACLGKDFADALLKALQAAELNIPFKGGSVLITVGGRELKKKITPLAKTLADMGFKIYATEHTAQALRSAGVNNIAVVYKVRESDKQPNILTILQEGKVHLVINIPTNNSESYVDTLEDEYTIRRLAVEFNVPVLTTFELAKTLVEVLRQRLNSEPEICSLNEYYGERISFGLNSTLKLFSYPTR